MSLNAMEFAPSILSGEGQKANPPIQINSTYKILCEGEISLPPLKKGESGRPIVCSQVMHQRPVKSMHNTQECVARSQKMHLLSFGPI
jgi:hypothetical protein